MSRASIAAGIAAAKLRGSGTYFNPGKGEATVLSAKIIQTSESGAVFSVKLLIDSCEPFKGLKDENGNAKAEGNPVGSTADLTACIESANKYQKEYAFEDMTRFLQVTLDEPTEAILKDLDSLLGLNADGITDDAKPQPMRGMRVGYRTEEKKTAPKDGSKPKMITKVLWATIAQTQEDVNKRAGELTAAKL